jgi:hypothetical protein
VFSRAKTDQRMGPAPAFLLSLCWLQALPALATAPSLSVEPLNVRQQGTITFAVLAAGEAGLPSGADLVSAETEDHKYKLMVDLNSLRPGRFGTFAAELYVLPEDSTHASNYKFVLTGSPIGPFLDVDDRIAVDVVTGRLDSKGYVNLPLHSGGQVDLLSTDGLSQPLEIKLGDEKGPELTVRSKLENLKLIITSMDVDYGCTKCWKAPTQPTHELIIDENGSATLPIKFTPNTLSALGASAFSLKSDQPHDTLMVQVTYHAAYGGQERKQRFSIPVRFSPSLWTLLTAVCIGACLGFLANIILDPTSRTSWRTVGNTAAKSFVLVAVVELVAIAMAAYGSKVVIFTFDLDPRQFLPTVVIGVLVSGGATVVSFLKQVFGK